MKNFIFALLSVLLSVLLLTTPGFAQERTNLYARNIVIVFDASLSMEENISTGSGRIQKITAAKNAVRKVVAALPPNTNVGLFVFGNVRNYNPVPIGPKNDALISDAIAGIGASGGTPLGEYIQMAADQLLVQREKNLGYGWYQLIVVTDGEANNKSLMDKVATEVLRRGLAMDVIGVGMTNTHSLAKRSTSYRAANDTAALDKALEEVTAETGSNSSTNNDDFELISWLSEDQAKGVISTLGNNENQPLFEKPKVFEAPVQQSAAAKVESLTAQGTSQPVVQGGIPTTVIVFFGIIGAILLIVVIVIISRN